MELALAIWAKYFGTLFRQPDGGTLMGRWDQGVWSTADQTGGEEGRQLSNASFTSSSLELALLLPSVEHLYWLYFLFSAEGTLSTGSSL